MDMPTTAGPGPDPSWPVNYRFRRLRPATDQVAVGDRQVDALLVVHRRIARLGVHRAGSELTIAQLAAAVRASRYFGLPELAALLAGLPAALNGDQAERAFDARYRALLPDEAALRGAIRQKVADCPGEFTRDPR